MTLRSRLFLTTLLIAVPLAITLFLVEDRIRLSAMEQELRRSVAFDLSAGLQQRCESDPPRIGRPGRGGGAPPPPRFPGRARGGTPPPNGRGPGPGNGGYEFFAYDATGRPTAADAPPLPDSRDGERAMYFWSGLGRGVGRVVPLGGEGPCAFLLARIPPRPGELRGQAEALALVLFSVLAAASLAVGPVIAKLRRLQVGVRQAAASHYEDSVTVEGRDEVAALAGAFNEAGRLVRTHLMDVQAREQALRVFVANTTHDVAIPLTVLQGHLTELDRELAAAPATREHVRAAMQEAHYMASLLRNLGAATRLDEAGALALLSPVDVSALVECVVTRHRPIARVSGVDLNVAVPDPPLVVSSDPTLLEQALSNLVDNAIRYNHAGGHVAVLLDGKADRFTLSVTDDGPGVTDEELARLTTRWFRGSEARTRRPDGKGLGLAIVAESVARVGLTLTFHRPESAGLRAEIQGPLWPSVRSPG